MGKRTISNFKEEIKNSHYRLIMDCLKDVPEDEPFYVHLEIGDLVSGCTKKTLFERAFEQMPYYFYCGWWGLKKSNSYWWEPTFCRVEQAAWDAAQAEYTKDKMEYCAKWGCE